MLLASQQNADLWTERREGDVPIIRDAEDHGQDRIDEEVELHSAKFHAAVFGFPQHRIFYLEIEGDRSGQLGEELL